MRSMELRCWVVLSDFRKRGSRKRRQKMEKGSDRKSRHGWCSEWSLSAACTDAHFVCNRGLAAAASGLAAKAGFESPSEALVSSPSPSPRLPVVYPCKYIKRCSPRTVTQIVRFQRVRTALMGQNLTTKMRTLLHSRTVRIPVRKTMMPMVYTKVASAAKSQSTVPPPVLGALGALAKDGRQHMPHSCRA